MPQPSHHRLFQDKTLTQALKGFLFPADIGDRHQKLLQWVQALESGTLDVVKETSLHGDFLKDVFQDALGYRSVIGGAGHPRHAPLVSHRARHRQSRQQTQRLCQPLPRRLFQEIKKRRSKGQATLAPKTSKPSPKPTATMPCPFSSAAATA
ncbi:hypothetical protein H6G07_07045 [Phormidium tenue FACHB-1052]|uniref:Uncharacterized protein n=1 Tax=Phormidium tenue NIES-30 TaxID=549789 RepID=A0A1U7J8D1_9CYAN|nr:hypothetical protein [Phormidium tenue FACHB-1052]OKH49566.1 hypothetical protein NIES30_06925 [Phormidium tenue NIES-30]